LSVFAGGWTLDVAEQVCQGEGIDRYDVLDLLTGLVDKSLVTTDERGPETRYRLLETVRQYATARLADAGEVDGLRDRHLAFYVALAEAAEPQVLGAGRDDSALHSVAAELPNLRAALEWAAATDPNAGLHLVNALALFWLFTGRYQEGDTAYARALDAADEEPTPLRGRALAGRGHLAQHGGAYEAAHGWAQTALDIGQTCGDPRTQGRALNILGRSVGIGGDLASGRSLLEQSVQLATLAGDDWCRTSASQTLAIAWCWQDEFDTARPILDDAYPTATQLGFRRGIALHWFCLGWEATVHGRLGEACELFPRAVAASDEVGDPFPSGLANSFLAYVQLACGDAELAYSLASENLRQVREAGAGLASGFANQMLGRTEMVLGQLTAAREHLQTAVDVDRPGFAYALTWDLAALGTLDRLDGNLHAARIRGEEALAVARRLGGGWMKAGAERLLGRLALVAGEATEAERYVHDALGRLVAKGFAIDIPECLDVLGAVAATQESFEEAARLLGAAAAGRQRLGIVRFPPEPQFWAAVEH
ncbi:MAG: hypothetical protein ACRDS9_27735, partial [Pseudonocardiaceae bacterium]